MFGKKINYEKEKGRKQIQRVSCHPNQWKRVFKGETTSVK